MNRSDSVFANLVVQKKLASREQVDECIEIVGRAAEAGTPAGLADTMVGKGYLSRSDADALLAQARPGGAAKRLGGYELLGELSRGGMGVVYKARQIAMDRIVALKILRPSLSNNKAYIERFFHEAKSAAKLNHPNIIHVIDAGLADGYHFFVMEFVDGCTLAERLQQGRFDEAQALKIAHEMAQALSHAQQYGIVHRDIKPENIMLTGDGTAKLADLGVARGPEAGEAASDDDALGTPYYMSPEQARGEAAVDVRSDIYSLGATLFHLVTGSVPFDGETPAIVASKRLTEPVPVAAALRPDIHPAVDELIQRMMAKDPAKRPQTADELLAEIEAAMQAPALGLGLRFARRRHRPPRASAERRLIVAGVAAVVLAVVIAVILNKQGPEQPYPARRLFQEAVSYQAQRPDDLVGSIERFARIVRDYKGTDSAERAQKRLDELSRRKERKELVAGIAELRKTCTGLIDAQKYGEALAEANAFEKENEPALAGTAVKRIRKVIRTNAESRCAKLIAQSDAALARGDYSRARRALEPIAGFGIDEHTKITKKKLHEIAAREAQAGHRTKWERISGEVKKLLDDGRYEDAAKVLAGAGNLPAERFGKQRDELAREIERRARLQAEDREAALKEALKKYTKDFEARIRPIVEQRSYEKAAAELDRLAKQRGLKPDAKRVERDRQDIARLAAFWKEVDERAAGLEVGELITIDGKHFPFAEYRDGTVFYKSGPVQTGTALTKIGVRDIVGLFGREFPENEEQKLRAAAFLLFDKEPDRTAARRILLKAQPGDDAEHYLVMVTGPGDLDTDERAAREAFAAVEKTAAPGSAGMKAALAEFHDEFGYTRFYNDQLSGIEKLRSGESDQPTEKPTIPDLGSETNKTLQGYWSMGGTRDDRIRDKSGRGNDARPRDDVRFGAGISGGCADLERGYIEVPYDMGLITKGSFSIDFCMKAKSLFRYSAGPPVISLGADRSGELRRGISSSFSLRIRKEGLGLDFRPRARGNDADGAPAVHPINKGEWYHVALVVDSAEREAAIYVGGEKVQNIKMSAVFDNTTGRHPFVMGGRGTKRYRGFIDEVHLWLRPLSPEQVMTLAKHWSLGPAGAQADIKKESEARIADYKARLTRTTSWKNVGLPLQYAIITLLNKVEVPYQWDSSAKAIGSLAEKRIRIDLADIQADEALRRTLAPLKLTYEVDDAGVILRPQK